MQDTLLIDALNQLLADQCTPAVVRAIEAGGPTTKLWQAIEASGFCDALLSEAQGGAGLGLKDAFALFSACGEHLLPVPLAQTQLARALLAQGGLSAPAGAVALAGVSAAVGTGDELLLGYGAVADWLLLGDGHSLRLFDMQDAQREPLGDNSLDARVRLPATAALTLPSAVDLRAQQALLLAAQMAGSMSQVFARSLQYANERVQFGRSIGKFQAIQHQLAQMAEHVQAATMAARLGCATAHSVADTLACAVAKAATSAAVVPVCGFAHAVHGAIGITQEYDLQLHTRRLQAWRTCAGSESHWNERVGRALLAGPHASLPEFVRTRLHAND